MAIRFLTVISEPLNKICSKNIIENTISEKDFHIFVPYLGKTSLSTRSTVQKTIFEFFSHFLVVFKIKNR